MTLDNLRRKKNHKQVLNSSENYEKAGKLCLEKLAEIKEGQQSSVQPKAAKLMFSKMLLSTQQ